MKLTILCFAALIAYVAAENCLIASQCDYETCSGDGWTINCHRGTCTCDHGTHTGSTCTSASDCSGLNCPTNFLHEHCLDGQCRCTPGGGK